MICPACGATTGGAGRFCASCGRPLHVVDDERRVVTVLFADLVGFTTLSEHLDPERVKNLVDRCFDRLALDITAFGGQVDKIIGDAIVALFGVPASHEDDAERAVRAALRMQETLCLEADAIGAALQIRIGINTGEVLVGAMRAAGSVTAMGDVVNTASRLQTAAGPGEVFVGPSTHAVTQQAISYEARGLLAAKGRDEPVETWKAVLPTLPPGYRARREGVRLVGREHEIALLQHSVASSVRHHRTLLVLLLGDVGMGKSRLAHEVAEWAGLTQGTVLREGRCAPYGEANVWWPVAEALRGALRLEAGDDVDRGRATIHREVASLFGEAAAPRDVDRTTEGLLTLMGYDSAVDADPATIREEAGRALSLYVAASAQRQPILLELSDLHFADDVVLDLIDDVFDQVHPRPIIMIATARSSLLERWSPRPGRHNTFVFHLDPLDRSGTGELAAALTANAVSPVLADALFERSGGNPFFVEELVTLLEGNEEDPEGSNAAAAAIDRLAALPDTLRGLVVTRLDDLAPPVRALVQDAAVIGQRGPVDGLKEMAAQLDRSLDVDVSLASLVAEGIMELDAGYWAFRSELVREVAYQMITKAERATRHYGIAIYLERKLGGQPNGPVWLADQLAHHYSAAAALAEELGPLGRTRALPPDLPDRARRWVVEVAGRARRDRAIPTAVRLYTQALQLLGPDLTLRPAEAVPLLVERASLAVESWDLDRALADVYEATRLSDVANDPDGRARALVVRGAIEQREGDVDAAVATLSLAAANFAALGDDGGHARALRELALVEILGGRMTDAEVSAAGALEGFEAIGDRAGQGWSLQNLAWIAFATGRPDEADVRTEAAIARFTEVEDSRGLAWAHGLLGWIRFQQGRIPEASVLGDEVLAEARSRSDPWATGMMLLLIASIKLWSGHSGDAVVMAADSQRMFETLGDAYGGGQASGVLGRAMVMTGQVEAGLDLLARAGSPPGAVEGSRGPASGQVARFARLASAIQLGQPELGDDVVDELESLVGVGGDDPLATLGMFALQRGEVDLAAGYLLRAERSSADPNLVACRAMLSAATGGGQAGPLADMVDDLPGATYLDRAIAQLAAGLEAAAHQDGNAARGRVVLAIEAVGATDDQVSQAVVALGAAGVARRLGDDDAEARAAHADQAIAGLGIAATGWRVVFDRALGAVPA
ncbi:MAG: adenylate/guanylate cyclase domain-containing protein [Aquihabitans sp.]